MFIGVTTFGGDGGKSGISQYILAVLKEFADENSSAQKHRFDVSAFESECKLFTPDVPHFSANAVSSKWQNTLHNLLWHQTELPTLCKNKKYDVLFLPAGNRRLPACAPCPTVGTVHDFSSLHIANKYDASHMFYIKRVLPALVRRLDAVITISESSKRDIVEYAKVSEERVHVIPNGVNHTVYYPQQRSLAKMQVRSKHGIDMPYLLYISRIENPGKNHIRLIRAFDRLKQSHKLPHELVLVGSDWDRADEVHRVANEVASSNAIRFTGFTASEDLPALYNAADAFVFPSLYEGFGLPVLEAMACGIPVAGANTSSVPEVIGDAGILFDPYNEENIADSILQILTDSELARSLSERGLQRASQYDWHITAERTLNVLCNTVKSNLE